MNRHVSRRGCWSKNPVPLVILVTRRPPSDIVGTSGATPVRLALVTPSAFNLPDFTSGTPDRMLLEYSVIRPPMRSAKAGALTQLCAWREPLVAQYPDTIPVRSIDTVFGISALD